MPLNQKDSTAEVKKPNILLHSLIANKFTLTSTTTKSNQDNPPQKLKIQISKK